MSLPLESAAERPNPQNIRSVRRLRVLPPRRILDFQPVTREVIMSVFDSSPSTPLVLRSDDPLRDEAELAAVAFLARYNGRTLESYRTDMRQYFQWCHHVAIAPLSATRTHIC